MRRVLRATTSRHFLHHLAATDIASAGRNHHHLTSTSSLPWNSLLRSHLSSSHPHLALSLYRRMRAASPHLPDSYTLPLALRAATSASASGHNLSAAVHAHAVVLGLHLHFHVANELLVSYAKLGPIVAARQVFDAMPVRNLLSWNALLSGYSRNRDVDNARDVFARMLKAAGPAPNAVSWTALLSAHARCAQHAEVVALFGEMQATGCEGNAEAVAVALAACPYTGDAALEKGRVIHGYGVRSGFHDYSFVRNSLICMYGKLGSRLDAEKLFWEAEGRDAVAWNALISSCAAAGLHDRAFEVFARMDRSGQVVPNVVSWSAMIGGFASGGDVARSLELFRQMQERGLAPNAVTSVTVLSACAELSVLQSGREIHGHVIRALMDQNLLVGNGLLNMYAKCGRVRAGRLVFDRMKSRDLISWNSMITGYGMHGLCHEALATFDDMVRVGIEPDGVTFVAILSACSHTGRVSEGRRLFDRMVHECKISPSMEHYSCMVDLLGRAGLLKEAADLIETMPIKPNICVWGALLNSCSIHGDTAVADKAIARVLEIEGETTGNHMLISNLYATCGMWEDSKMVRVMTKSKGLKKNPGQSWIEVKNKVFAFAAGNASLPGAEEVYGVLEDLYRQMENEKCTTEDCVRIM